MSRLVCQFSCGAASAVATKLVLTEYGPGAKFFRNRRTNERIYLRELDPTHGRIEEEPEISCSFFCEAAEKDINE